MDLNDPALQKTIEYMKAHWPSDIKDEWQVKLEDYPVILQKILADFTKDKTKNKNFVRIAGLSGSGKTTQILPAAQVYFEKHNQKPVLIAARLFVKYHPHYQDIKDFYGDENLRKKTDEFSTIMIFLTLKALTGQGFDIILDVTLLDPGVEQILLNMLRAGNYKTLLLMTAASPVVAEHFLNGRSWRHSKETEDEFITATKNAFDFYAKNAGDERIILWSVYDEAPVYDGKIKNAVEIFEDYSTRTELPKNDDDARREAKIKYLQLI